MKSFQYSPHSICMIKINSTKGILIEVLRVNRVKAFLASIQTGSENRLKCLMAERFEAFAWSSSSLCWWFPQTNLFKESLWIGVRCSTVFQSLPENVQHFPQTNLIKIFSRLCCNYKIAITFLVNVIRRLYH